MTLTQSVVRPGLRFTERMAGFLSTRVKEGYEVGYALGRDEGMSIEFIITIEFPNLDAALGNPSLPGTIAGTVTAPAVSPSPLVVTKGEFVLLKPDPDRVETSTMRYDMDLQGEDGRRFQLAGFKVLHDRAGLDAWSDTTTLFITIRDGDGVVGVGMMRISFVDFLRQLLTISVLRVPDIWRRIRYTGQFGWKFAGSLLRIYGGPLDEPWRFPEPPKSPTLVPPELRLPKAPKGQVRWCDGQGCWQEGTDLGQDAWLRLTRYKGGKKGPVLLAPGFGMSAFSYATRTIEPNLTEFLVKAGYDVWLFDYRASIDLPSAKREFTIDDIATSDWPAAIAEVRRATKRATKERPVQALGHCVGSVSLLMALLSGAVNRDHVRSAVCAQFVLFFETSWFNRLKARLHVSEWLEKFGIGLVWPNVRFSLPNVIMDLGLRALPMARRERCGLAICRWVNAIYGCTHAHAQLNNATHLAFPRMFGVGSVEALQHLALMVQHGKAVDHYGRDVYLPHYDRARIPILFLQGDRNYIFRPEGSRLTLRYLRQKNGAGLYRREILRGFAHLDAMVGREASQDVFPKIVEFLDGENVAAS